MTALQGHKGSVQPLALQSRRPLGRGRKSRLRRTHGQKKLFIRAVNGSESIEPHSLLVNIVSTWHRAGKEKALCSPWQRPGYNAEAVEKWSSEIKRGVNVD